MYLLVADGEFALCLFVRLGVAVEFLDCLVVLCHCLCEFDVSLCILVAGVYFCVVWQCGQSFVQRLMHLFGCALEEAAAAANEQCVTGEDSLVVSVLEVEADAVLCVAWCVKSGNFDGTDVERLLVGRSLVDQGAVTTANDGELVVLELRQSQPVHGEICKSPYNLLVPPCMVMMTTEM